jgi:hypothetical protein
MTDFTGRFTPRASDSEQNTTERWRVRSELSTFCRYDWYLCACEREGEERVSNKTERSREAEKHRQKQNADVLLPVHITRALLVRVVGVETNAATEGANENLVLREARNARIRRTVTNAAALRAGEVVRRRLTDLRSFLRERKLL